MNEPSPELAYLLAKGRELELVYPSTGQLGAATEFETEWYPNPSSNRLRRKRSSQDSALKLLMDPDREVGFFLEEKRSPREDGRVKVEIGLGPKGADYTDTTIHCWSTPLSVVKERAGLGEAARDPGTRKKTIATRTDTL